MVVPNEEATSPTEQEYQSHGPLLPGSSTIYLTLWVRNMDPH